MRLCDFLNVLKCGTEFQLYTIFDLDSFICSDLNLESFGFNGVFKNDFSSLNLGYTLNFEIFSVIAFPDYLEIYVLADSDN